MIKKQGGRKKVIDSESDMEVDEEEEEDEDASEIDEDESDKWDEKCYICGKKGKVLLCEGCTNVAHLGCTELKSEPTGDWHCEECLIKQTQRRTTRGQVH